MAPIFSRQAPGVAHIQKQMTVTDTLSLKMGHFSPSTYQRGKCGGAMKEETTIHIAVENGDSIDSSAMSHRGSSWLSQAGVCHKNANHKQHHVIVLFIYYIYKLYIHTHTCICVKENETTCAQWLFSLQHETFSRYSPVQLSQQVSALWNYHQIP